MSHVVPIVLCGHRGKMGRTLSQVLADGRELSIVAEVGPGDDLQAGLRTGAQAMVDFTMPGAAFANATAAAAAGVAPVVGTSGLEPGQVDELEQTCRETGGAVIPNFAVGAVLMIRLAEIGAPYFDQVEVIERHDVHKKDAPSGTAVATVRRLAATRADWPAVPTHSVRLPGVVAEQEVVFGALGQTLSIAHRTTSREAYVPGVIAAVRAVVENRRFYRSLDQVLGL